MSGAAAAARPLPDASAVTPAGHGVSLPPRGASGGIAPSPVSYDDAVRSRARVCTRYCTDIV